MKGEKQSGQIIGEKQLGQAQIYDMLFYVHALTHTGMHTCMHIHTQAYIAS